MVLSNTTCWTRLRPHDVSQEPHHVPSGFIGQVVRPLLRLLLLLLLLLLPTIGMESPPTRPLPAVLLLLLLLITMPLPAVVLLLLLLLLTMPLPAVALLLLVLLTTMPLPAVVLLLLLPQRLVLMLAPGLPPSVMMPMLLMLALLPPSVFMPMLVLVLLDDRLLRFLLPTTPLLSALFLTWLHLS